MRFKWQVIWTGRFVISECLQDCETPSCQTRCLVAPLFDYDRDFSVWLSHTSLLCRTNNNAHSLTEHAEVMQDPYQLKCGLIAVISRKGTKIKVYLSEKYTYSLFPPPPSLSISVADDLKTKAAAYGNNICSTLCDWLLGE